MDTIGSPGSFPQTRWSVVLAARDVDAQTSRRALAELCEIYWYPLYAFARRKGFTPEDAEDATQEFFQTVVQKDIFAQTDTTLGRLRTFLLRGFERDLLDARREANRKKRGGGIEIISLDLRGAEERFQQEHLAAALPEAEFDHAWARTIVSAALQRVEREYSENGKEKLFAALKGFINVEEPERGEYDLVANALGMTRAAARQSVHRLRNRFREVVRGEVAETLANPTPVTIQDELETLRVALKAAA